MEILDRIHRIDAEVGGRPLYLFLFLGERNLLLDDGHSERQAAHAGRNADGHIVYRAKESR